MGKQTLRPPEWVAGVRELMVRYEIARSGTGDEDTAGMAPRLGAEATTWPSAPVSSPQRAGRDAGALISPPASANGEDASLICALSTRIASVMKAVRNTACDGDGPAVKGSSLFFRLSTRIIFMMKAVRAAAPRPGAMGTGRIESSLRRRRAVVSPPVGCPHHGWGTMRHSRGFRRLANARNLRH